MQLVHLAALVAYRLAFGPMESQQNEFPCSRCGAKLHFLPGTTHLKCPYCTTENEIPAAGEIAGPDGAPATMPVIEELDFRAQLDEREAASPTVERVELTCQSCNAHVQMPDNVTSMKCPYCSTPIVATGKSVKVLKPRSLLPFGIDDKKAREVLRSWLAGRWFAPSGLKSSARVDAGVKGVYVPYWTYDSRVTTGYTGQRGEHYYVTVRNGNQTRQERRTRWYPASGTVRNTFDDVLVAATGSIASERLYELEPWDLNALVSYQDQFLSGFSSETYSVSLNDGFVVAKQRMEPEIDSTIRRDIGGDEQRISGKRSSYEGITFKHILLPVWLLAYRFNGKAFQITVNARTGEVHGDRPYSALKIAMAVVAGLIVLGIIIAIASQR